MRFIVFKLTYNWAGTILQLIHVDCVSRKNYVSLISSFLFDIVIFHIANCCFTSGSTIRLRATEFCRHRHGQGVSLEGRPAAALPVGIPRSSPQNHGDEWWDECGCWMVFFTSIQHNKHVSWSYWGFPWIFHGCFEKIHRSSPCFTSRWSKLWDSWHADPSQSWLLNLMLTGGRYILIGGPGPPLWKMMDFVNWDDHRNPIFPYISGKMPNSRQPFTTKQYITVISN